MQSFSYYTVLFKEKVKNNYVFKKVNAVYINYNSLLHERSNLIKCEVYAWSKLTDDGRF